MSCIGCKHYVTRFEECRALAGVLHCPKCDKRWHIDERVECPSCAESSKYKHIVEAALCYGGQPSKLCPGFEELPPDVRQKSLF